MTTPRVDPAHRSGEGPSGFDPALQALEAAGIKHRLRKPRSATDEPVSGAELDIWLRPGDIRAADAALEGRGFHRFAAPGVGPHRFYLSCQEGRWLKLDVKLDARLGADRESVSPWAGAAGWVGRLRRGISRRWIASARRAGPVVAVLGPDGAGKGAVVAGLRRAIPVAVTPVYLGLRRRRRPGPSSGRESGPPSGGRSPRTSHRSAGAGRASSARETAFVLRTALGYGRRLLPAYLAAWRGDVILCDRHPIEVLAVEPDRGPLAALLERFIAAHLIPRPDAVIVLDAPGEVLFQRKGEHSVEVLEAWRRRYADVFVLRGAVLIETTLSFEETLARASQTVWGALCRRRAW